MCLNYSQFWFFPSATCARPGGTAGGRQRLPCCGGVDAQGGDHALAEPDAGAASGIPGSYGYQGGPRYGDCSLQKALGGWGS